MVSLNVEIWASATFTKAQKVAAKRLLFRDIRRADRADRSL